MNQPNVGGGGGGGNQDLVKALRELLAYPVRTVPTAPPRDRDDRRAGDLKESVDQAIGNVLGWRRRPPKIEGVVSALEQAFEPYEEHGRTLYRHKPNIASFHSELEGGVVGAQASLHVRAKEAVNRSLPLLQDLRALKETADDDVAAALKSIIETEARELVEELGRLGGPRVHRVNQLWRVLLGPVVVSGGDPDCVGGQLGELRTELGLSQAGSDRTVINAAEEQQLTSFRIVVDDLVSLRASWDRDQKFFGGADEARFLGMRLVVLERRLAVVSGSVGELRSALDSVLLDADERRTFRIPYPAGATSGEGIFLEDLIDWTEDFATQEGPRLVKDGGRVALDEALPAGARELRRLTEAAAVLSGGGNGLRFSSPAVLLALNALEEQLFDIVHESSGAPAEGLTVQRVDDKDNQISTLALFEESGSAYRSEPLRLEAGEQLHVRVHRLAGNRFYPRKAKSPFTQPIAHPGRYVVAFDAERSAIDPDNAVGVEVF
ncbi:hypothetical protein JD79_00368 [Geodermatophilus normandii]|uniref:Uncharacterized protein n=1 Tax=Geodermatophilus normandii TaxID=1137989 RepID=A0A317QI15_9ACTN|nr:hypothetical protein [Geodermatophilus normandii]PWW21240.1 hypothetical protein JD79_00368 [Geodermatophilus normandii]